MFQEVLVEYTKVLENGKEKVVKEQYLTENVLICSESEKLLLEYIQGDCEVVSIKRSNIKEFINENSSDANKNEDIYKAKLTAIFVGDDGGEKETHYIVAIWAGDLNEANSLLKEYVRQGMTDLSIDGINKTKIMGVLKEQQV